MLQSYGFGNGCCVPRPLCSGDEIAGAVAGAEGGSAGAAGTAGGVVAATGALAGPAGNMAAGIGVTASESVCTVAGSSRNFT